MKPTINVFKKFIANEAQMRGVQEVLSALSTKYNINLFLFERSGFDIFDYPIFSGLYILDAKGIGLALDMFAANSIERSGLTEKYLLEVDHEIGSTKLEKLTNLDKLL
jgi:hypothetical protein